MKVYKVITYGIDMRGFIVAATSIEEAIKIVENVDMGYIDYISELRTLSTSETVSCIIEEF